MIHWNSLLLEIINSDITTIWNMDEIEAKVKEKKNIQEKKFTLKEFGGAFGDWGTLISYIMKKMWRGGRVSAFKMRLVLTQNFC